MAEYLVQSVLTVAQGEVGYQEKASNSQLDDKHANPGSGNDNYTRYHRDMGHSFGDAWCQTFVDWCFAQAYGKEGASYLLCNNSTTASTMSQKNSFQNAGQLVDIPQPGDIWWRERPKGGHVGIIISASLSSDRSTIIINTIEGNTSPQGSSGSAWNGDGVYPKSHRITVSTPHKDENGNTSWFGRPKYTGTGSLTPYTGGSVLESDSIADGFSVKGLAQNIKETTSNIWNGVTDTLGGIGSAIGGVIAPIQGFIDSANDFGKALTDIPSVLSAIGEHFNGGFLNATFELAYQTVTTEIERDEIKTVNETNLDRVKSANLLSYPSLVESPYIILTVGDYKFGTYSKQLIDTRLNVNYPNYIQSMTVEKVNGQVNQYTINLIYQIQTGDDPNLLDRIFSTVGYGTVKISYGDWSSPTFVYKEEEAIITDLAESVDFTNSRITYTLKCTSNSLVLASGYFPFPERVAKPSDVIYQILQDRQYGLQDIFTGMSNITRVKMLNLIATDDRSVKIEAQQGMDALSYLNYLVTCMCSNTSDPESPLKDSAYYLTIHDDVFGENELNGPYFRVTKVSSTTKTLVTADTYEVDIGYPTDNLVTSFNIVNNSSWALLYNYSEKINNTEYAYSINNEGQLITKYSPAVATSSKNKEMTEAQKTWWTKMTQFPINAELGIKGLVRPAMLMTYLRVNALFFGQRHISSGLYVITKQVDTIDGSGYRTKLSLLRIAGDNDYIVKTKTKVTSNLPVSVNVTGTSNSNSTLPSYDEVTTKYSNVRNYDTSNLEEYDGQIFPTTDDMLSNDSVNYGLNSSTSYVNNKSKGRSYQVSDSQILGITAGCIAEQGSGIEGVAWEASLIANLTDESKSYSNPYDFINSKWFAKRTKKFVKEAAYIGADIDGYTLTKKHFDLVKDIIVNGNRWTNANEHDTVSDIKELLVHNTVISDKAIIKNKNNSSIWIPNVTIVYNTKGSKYKFIGFPGGNTAYDPFGVKF